MESLQHILKCQSLFLKAIILVLLVPANASLIPQRAEELMEPGYHCKNKVYSFRVIEEVRETACQGLIAINKAARRPLIYIHNDNVDDLIYEWSMPLSISRDSEEKITFDNRCELKDVLYYNGIAHRYEPCKKVPDVSTSTSFGVQKVPTDSSVHCGSLSWEIAEIQMYTSYHLSKFLKESTEVGQTSGLADGPWRRSIMRKRVEIRKTSKLSESNEVRGLIVTHHISQKVTAASNSNLIPSNLITLKLPRKKDSVRLVCLLDKTFPFLSSVLIADTPSSRKRKTQG
ncbi:putative effector protein [Blumeria hordei DH14]|uniref:Putative effector protein n=1 Tax=Blumeria graminis f. sp. hordei (strain DH14) TaxID=546991 RepID=N1JPN1_BLUG1|nr:putative effector protein [Blumeria hordei DH14]